MDLRWHGDCFGEVDLRWQADFWGRDVRDKRDKSDKSEWMDFDWARGMKAINPIKWTLNRIYPLNPFDPLYPFPKIGLPQIILPKIGLPQIILKSYDLYSARKRTGRDSLYL